MNEPRNLLYVAPRHVGRKTIAILGAALFVGVSLYAFRDLAPLPATALAADGTARKVSSQPASAMAAANAFLDGLDASQREKATYDFTSAKKPNWSNLPVTMVPRNGVRLGDLNKEQRTKAMDVVAAVLSKSGYQKVVDIMDADQKLVGGQGRGGKGKDKGKDKGGNQPPRVMFGTDQYYLAIFGKPSETQPWMVQFGGHHLGVNVTVIGKHFVLTPTHTGTQPALFKREGKDVRPLGQEIDSAFKLIGALDGKQREEAIIGQRPQQELLLGPGRDGKTIPPKGIKGSALTADQQALLLETIGAWVNIVESDAAAMRMAAIKDKIGDTYFAWSGPTEKGSAVYFRVQGPTVVIEYAPQGGTDHIHTVIRNPEDDYGVRTSKR